MPVTPVRAVMMLGAGLLPAAALPVAGASEEHNPAARGVVEVRRCQTIDQSGSYKAVNNLKANGDCLVITVEGVTIDLGGFTLVGDGSGTGIKGPKTPAGTLPDIRTVVRDGEITNFARATDLSGTVEGVRAISNGEGILIGVGIVRGSIAQLNTSVGISIADGLVSNNLVIANGTGISVQEAAVITGNEVSGNKIGIDLSGQGSALSVNVVDGNSEIGLRVRCPANLTNNTAIGNFKNLVLSDTTCLTIGNLAP